MSSYNMTKPVEIFTKKYYEIREYFAPKIPLIYADEALPMQLPLAKGAALIFPPSDYWAVRVDINAKNEKDAAKYGPALFDLGRSYRYEAKKVGDGSYVVIAYDPEILSVKLLSYGDLSMIDKITFAQWVFDKEAYAIHLKDNRYLTMLDGIVVEIDQSYLDKSGCIEINDALMNPNPFLKTFPIEDLAASVITDKTLRRTLIVLFVLFANFTTLSFFNHQESLRLSDHIQETLTASKLPETSIERDAILASLRLKEKKQLDLRNQSHKISTLPMEVKQPTIDTKSSTVPALPTVSAASLPPIPPILTTAGDVVLIPGSNPGEQNRLLVEKSSSSTNKLQSVGDGIEELTYDGHVINLIINTPDASTKEKLKNAVTKLFKNAQLNDHNTQLEVRLK